MKNQYGNSLNMQNKIRLLSLIFSRTKQKHSEIKNKNNNSALRFAIFSKQPNRPFSYENITSSNKKKITFTFPHFLGTKQKKEKLEEVYREHSPPAPRRTLHQPRTITFKKRSTFNK